MRFRSFALTLALFSSLATRVAAQCIASDGLDGGPACTSASTQVPQPKFQQLALGICWQNCGVSATAPYRAQWGMATAMPVALGTVPSCGWYMSSLILYQGSIPKWAGKMHLTYSRTWAEIGSGTSRYQVWRYLVNGDLSYVNPIPGPCAIPPCAAANANRIRYTGYIDYARDCSIAGGPISNAWMITHACDGIDHVAGYPRAGVFHPNRYYTFLGPRPSFVVGLGSTLENGASTSECVRKLYALTLPVRCDHEEPLLFANFSTTGSLCMCGAGPSLWHEASFNAAGIAGTTVTPYGGSDPFRSFPIGSWTNAAVYPGVEEVRWNTNDLQYVDCTGAGRNEYYYGATTAGGYPAFTINAGVPPVSLPTTFIDQSNSVILPLNVATRNTPYRSDHILNLNL